MSQSFAGIAALPYIGTYFKKPIPLFPGELALQGNRAKSTVPLNIVWNTYWQVLANPTSLGVQVSLDANNASGALIDKIRSVKIDNTNSTVPIYIIFPDTLDVITCPPQTVVVENVISDSLQFTIYAIGLSTGFIPTTLIQLLNYCLSPTLDPAVQTVYPQALGSPTIQRGNVITPGYGPPALGDQIDQVTVDLTTLNAVSSVLWGGPYSSGFITVTCMTAILIGIQTNQAAIQLVTVVLEATDGTLYTTFDYESTNGFFIPALIMDQVTNCNLKLDATKTWRLRTLARMAGVGQGLLKLRSTFSKNTI